MNVVLWIVQILLALHTAMGAMWKFSHSEQTDASLRAMPHALWTTLSGVEILCALGFVLPAVSKHISALAPTAALVVAGEMLLFCGFHLASGQSNHGHLVYWLVVAAVCAFVAYGRLVLKPL